MGGSDATVKKKGEVKGGKIDFDQLQQIGLGQLHLTDEEFWSMTPRAFFNAVEGMLQQRREVFELARLQTFCQVAAWVKIESPQSLWKFTWETEEKSTKVVDIEKQRKKAIQLIHTLRNRGNKNKDNIQGVGGHSDI